MPNDRFYQSKAWKALRSEVIRRARGVCEECGRRVAGRNAHVDHIKSMRTRPDLSLSVMNLRLLCVQCHMRKGCREDGVFGNKPRDYLGGCGEDGEPDSDGHPWNEV